LSTGTKRKRSSNGLVKKRSRRSSPGSNDSDENVDDDIPEAGIMKPDITFFGESLPDSFDRRLNEDKTKADLVIVIGTSLKVAPVSQVVGFMHPEVPQLYISREPVAHIDFDVDMLGDCDVVVAELCRRVGWKLEHEMIPKKQKVEVEAHEALPYRYVFKEVSK
jgi:NAD-dependent histone deacetylase SIR2